MKKFLAILFASVMVFALAAPAMATPNIIDEIWVEIDEPVPGENIQDVNNSFHVEAVYGNTTREDLGTDALYMCNTDGWCVKEGTGWIEQNPDTDPTFEAGKIYNVEINAFTDGENYLFNSSGVKFYVNGEEYLATPTQDNGKVEIATKGFNMAITNIDVTAPTPVAGTKISDYTFTITSVPEGALNAPSMVWWYSRQTGSGDYTLISDENAVFETGKDYKFIPVVFEKEGYVFSRDFTVVTVNGTINPTALAIDMESGEFACNPIIELGAVTSQNGTNNSNSNSTSPKLGDASNMTFGVLALIALVTGAGVTVFAGKKTR